MSLIYGVDTDKEVTPQMVRDAIIECFLNAHRDHLGLTGGDDQAERDYCTKIVEQSFTETRGDFHNPTKESVLSALPWLATFSKTFRDQTAVQEHLKEIGQLVALLK